MQAAVSNTVCSESKEKRTLERGHRDGIGSTDKGDPSGRWEALTLKEWFKIKTALTLKK